MHQQANTKQQSRRQPLVFYIEPDDATAQEYGPELEREYEVVRYTEGLPVLRWLAEHSDDELPNLIVMDYSLPDITALELLTVLRHDRPNRYDRVLAMMLSNAIHPDLRERLFRKEALGVMLRSTMSPRQVAQRIKRDVERRQGMAG